MAAEAAGLEGRTLSKGGAQMLGNDKFSEDRIPGGLLLPPGTSKERRRAIEYAEAFADGYNGDYRQYDQDCRNAGVDTPCCRANSGTDAPLSNAATSSAIVSGLDDERPL